MAGKDRDKDKEAPKKVEKKKPISSGGKKKPRKTKSSKKWKMYEGGKHKNKVCVKCGPGVFMGHHKNRWACGQCGYTEYIREEKK